MKIANIKIKAERLESDLIRQSKDKWLLHFIARRLPIWGLFMLAVFAYKLAVIYLNRPAKDLATVISFELDSFLYISSSFFQYERMCLIAWFIVAVSGAGVYWFYISRKKIAKTAKEIEKSTWYIAHLGMALIVFFPFVLYANQTMALLIGCFYNAAVLVVPMLLNKIFGYTRSYERSQFLSKCAQMLIEKIDDDFFGDVSAAKAYYELTEKVHEMKFLSTTEDAFYLLEQISSKVGKK